MLPPRAAAAPETWQKRDCTDGNGHHRYVRCSVTPERWRSDYRVVPSVVQSDDGGVRTLASWVVEQGRAGAEQI